MMSDDEYDEKWARRRRIQRVVLAAMGIVATAALVLPLLSSLA